MDAVGAVGVAVQTLLGPLEDIVADAAAVGVWGSDQEEFLGISRHDCLSYVE